MLKHHVKSLVILLFMSYGVKCDSCVTYNFEADFVNSFTTDNQLCNGLPRWNIGNYSSLDIEGPSSSSEVFIAPNDIISCVSSFVFEMEATGVIEVYVYMDSVSPRDQLVVLAHQAGNDALLGTVLVSPMTINYHTGWNVLRISLLGVDTFNGYVSFLGSAAEGSTVIVDSFRYISPSIEEETCQIYEDILHPPAPVPEEPECAAFSFEQEFDVTFNSGLGLCNGLSPWSLKNYTAVSVASPSSDSEQFITPSSIVSCVSSQAFAVEAGGTVEVNIYMKSGSEFDQIGVIANQIVPDGNDAVTGSAVLTPLHPQYNDGWQILSVTLSGDGFYDGYISFIGVASEDSVVLIDSFRYIPPTFDQQDCRIYEEDFKLPVTDIGTDCVTYDFETDFETAFDNSNQICIGYSSWHLGTYYSLPIESFDPNSSTFISPNETSSCITSFTFPMAPGGTVEVNVFMESIFNLDYIIVLALKVVPNGVDTVAGFELYYANNENFVQGWNVLKVTVSDFASFQGYITLMGSRAEDSIGLIDSFRYIPPDSNENCEIY